MLYDCLGVLAINISNGEKEINDFLSRHNIGYRCNYSHLFFSLYWETVDENVIISKISDTSKEVIQFYLQASQEFERVKKTLEDAENGVIFVVI